MTRKVYWRGFIDAQGPKTDYNSKAEIVTSDKRSTLKELAQILDVDIQNYRSGYYVELPDKWHKTFIQDKEDDDYLIGWFAARGKISPDRKRLSISGANVEKFSNVVGRNHKIRLPEPQFPSKTSKMKRIIITGTTAQQLLDILGK